MSYLFILTLFLFHFAEYTSRKVFVPTAYIGMVIGRRGRVVHRLQAAHKVFVETPLSSVRPFFHIHGDRAAVNNAINSIYELLASRTGIAFLYSQRLVDGVVEVHLEM